MNRRQRTVERRTASASRAARHARRHPHGPGGPARRTRRRVASSSTSTATRAPASARTLRPAGRRSWRTSSRRAGRHRNGWRRGGDRAAAVRGRTTRRPGRRGQPRVGGMSARRGRAAPCRCGAATYRTRSRPGPRPTHGFRRRPPAVANRHLIWPRTRHRNDRRRRAHPAIGVCRGIAGGATRDRDGDDPMAVSKRVAAPYRQVVIVPLLAATLPPA